MSYAQRQRDLRDAEIVKLIRLGWTSVRIARRMDVSTKTVARVRKETGLSGTKRPPLTAEQLEKAGTLLADGASRAETARSVGCSVDQLRHAFPGQAWSREQMTEGEHATGIRAHTAPIIKGRHEAVRPAEPGPAVDGPFAR